MKKRKIIEVGKSQKRNSNKNNYEDIINTPTHKQISLFDG